MLSSETRAKLKIILMRKNGILLFVKLAIANIEVTMIAIVREAISNGNARFVFNDFNENYYIEELLRR